MLCVVYWHISIYTGTTDSPVNLIYMPFYMTLFFFLNGFFSHTIILTLSEGWEKVKKRFFSLLLPTIITGSLWVLYTNRSVESVLFNEMKGGYWFTFVAFEIYVLYIILKVLLIRIQKSINELYIWCLVILLFSILAYIGHQWDNVPFWHLFSGYQVVKYIPFFILGVICKINIQRFYALLNMNWVLSLSLFIMILFYLYPNKIGTALQGYLGILLVYTIFARNTIIFGESHWVGRSLTYIGRHTLPIYFFHYFFLSGLSYMNVILRPLMVNNAWVISLIVTLLCAVIVTICCLIVEKLLRIVPQLYFCLLGPQK